MFTYTILLCNFISNFIIVTTILWNYSVILLRRGTICIDMNKSLQAQILKCVVFLFSYITLYLYSFATFLNPWSYRFWPRWALNSRHWGLLTRSFTYFSTIVLLKYNYNFSFSNRQFGFIPASITQLCKFILYFKFYTDNLF